MPKRLRLREYQKSAALELSPQERDFLLAAIPDLRAEPVRGAREAYTLTPGATVGAIEGSGLVVEIAPKVSIERLIFMLSYGLGLARWQSPVDLQSASTVNDAMATVLIWHVNRAIRAGVLHGYRVEEDALWGIRGRVRFEEQLRKHYSLPMPVESRFDVFSEDILENQLILAALESVGRRSGLAKSVTDGLNRVRRSFARCASIEPHRTAVPAVRYDRLNQHYRGAVEWARLILQNSSFEISCGDHRGRGLLFDMNKVFETFVRTAVRHELGLSDSEFPDGSSCPAVFLDREHGVRLDPDCAFQPS